jgi:hypothetical protein
MVQTIELMVKRFIQSSGHKVQNGLDLELEQSHNHQEQVHKNQVLISVNKLSTMMITITKSRMIELKKPKLLLFYFVLHGEEHVLDSRRKYWKLIISSKTKVLKLSYVVVIIMKLNTKVYLKELDSCLLTTN